MRLRARHIGSFASETDKVLTPEEQAEYDCMVAGLIYYRIPSVMRLDILAAYNSASWPWTESDGCSLVTDWPTPHGYRAPYGVRHDYDCWLAYQESTWRERMRIRAEGDKRFYRIQVAYRVPRIVAAWRYAAVRAYWWTWGQWQGNNT